MCNSWVNRKMNPVVVRHMTISVVVNDSENVKQPCRKRLKLSVTKNTMKHSNTKREPCASADAQGSRFVLLCLLRLLSNLTAFYKQFRNWNSEDTLISILKIFVWNQHQLIPWQTNGPNNSNIVMRVHLPAGLKPEIWISNVSCYFICNNFSKHSFVNENIVQVPVWLNQHVKDQKKTKQENKLQTLFIVLGT